MAQVVKGLGPKPDGLGLISGTHWHVVVHTHTHTRTHRIKRKESWLTELSVDCLALVSI